MVNGGLLMVNGWLLFVIELFIVFKSGYILLRYFFLYDRIDFLKIFVCVIKFCFWNKLFKFILVWICKVMIWVVVIWFGSSVYNVVCCVDFVVLIWCLLGFGN